MSALKDFATQHTPSLDHISRLAFALAIGTGGGALFSWFNVPLAWMIGAMVACTLAAVANLPVAGSAPLRSGMIAVLGTMLGAAFTPQTLAAAAAWPITLTAMALYCIAVVVGVYIYFRLVGRLDPMTAYFSATPGGLSEMTAVGAQMGGDERIIALIHGSRVLLVVISVPLLIDVAPLPSGTNGAGNGGPGPLASAVGLGDISLSDYTLLAASAVFGLWGATRLRVPAGFLIGPLTLSAAVHLVGWTEAQPPDVFVFVAQVVIGTSVGCRFAGTPWQQVVRVLILSAGATVVMLTLAFLFAFAVYPLVSVDFAALVLGFIPGGLAEMSLIAIALEVDTAYVATHHIARILLIVVLAPLAFAVLRPWLTNKREQEREQR